MQVEMATEICANRHPKISTGKQVAPSTEEIGNVLLWDNYWNLNNKITVLN